MSKAACVLILIVAACAMGGSAQRTDDASNGNHPADAKQYHDAHNVTGDGPIQHDAAVQHDATVMPDAQQMGGGFCSDNTQCIPTECCWIAVCVPGTQVGVNLCFPS